MSAKPIPVIPPVIKTVTVECTPDEAFRYFTADFNKWWPVATHSVIAYTSERKQKPTSAVFEQRRGGRIFERGDSGEEHIWGTVLVWEPPSRVVFSFHPGRDDQNAQSVEVRFSAVAKGTEVVLSHTGWELLGENAEKEREGYNRGWESAFVAPYPEYVRACR
jgi:uncharacterized protein YndB with AHSA1/START domain